MGLVHVNGSGVLSRAHVSSRESIEAAAQTELALTCEVWEDTAVSTPFYRRSNATPAPFNAVLTPL